MAAMEALGIPPGAHLKTGPMPTVNLQLCANNADVEEVIKIKNTVNIGNKTTYTFTKKKIDIFIYFGFQRATMSGYQGTNAKVRHWLQFLQTI